MSAGAARILERAAYLARSCGQRNPHLALIEAGKHDQGDDPTDEGKALLAVMAAAGGTLVKWCDAPRTPEDAALLIEEALFQMQLGG